MDQQLPGKKGARCARSADGVLAVDNRSESVNMGDLMAILTGSAIAALVLVIA